MYAPFTDIFERLDHYFDDLEKRGLFVESSPGNTGLTVKRYAYAPRTEVSNLSLQNGEEFSGTLFGRKLEVKSSPGEKVTVSVSADSLMEVRERQEGEELVTVTTVRKRTPHGNQKKSDGRK